MVDKTESGFTELDFTSDIERLTLDFTGREWLFQEVNAWLKREGEPFFILTGEPGIGKSAFSAWLAMNRKEVAAFNFCMAGRNATIHPGTVLRSFGAQLCKCLPGYGEALINTIKPEKVSIDVKIYAEYLARGKITGVFIKNLHAGDPKDLLEIILRAPLTALPEPQETCIILVDSLDEAVTFGKEVNLVTLLTGLQDLPQWVRIFCTSRPDRNVLSYFNRLSPCVLKAESIRNQVDVENYITRRIAGEAFHTRIQSAGIDLEVLKSSLMDRDFHKGNFLFVKILLNDIETGRQSLENFSTLPRSIDEIYHGFLMRLKPRWNDFYQPILGVLVVARETLVEEQMSNFSGISRNQIRQSLGEVIQFLDKHGNGGTVSSYELYHQSFRDYLTDEKRSADFWCAPEDGHRFICEYYLNLHNDWKACDEYGLKHIISHVIGAKLTKEKQGAMLERLLTDEFLKEIEARFGWLYSFTNDLEILAQVDADRTISLCLKILLGSKPNSLIFQRLFRLLVSLSQVKAHIGNPRSSIHRNIGLIIKFIAEPHDIALQHLESLLTKVGNPRLRGIISLAMGETGSRKAVESLMEMLKTERRGGSWMAADALIALNDKGIIPDLLQWYRETTNGADKERILYILGWIHAEEGRTLISDGLASARCKNVGRAMDMMWLLNPRESDITFLTEKLMMILDSSPDKKTGLGPWSDEWLQKRIVRVLHKRHASGAINDLYRLQIHVAARGEPKDKSKRIRLEQEITQAIRELEELIQ